FLHSVESSLPAEQQKVIRMLHDPDQVFKDRKILLVDDDMRNTYALSKVLQKSGLNVVMADNGKLALEKLEAEKDVELVVMDIMMPMMDGYEAMRAIRAQKRFEKLPIIALTAKAMPEDRAKCLEAGANDYLTKPVDVEDLLSLMRVWLFQHEHAAV
ncbi:MAG: response regulator, partial [Candidatus Nealsonbacteria bacterium]|nr:response regulator [Candidatus Nealsonbacteria bacterium]